MKHFNYIIIGGGLAGDSAVRGIRELDKEGSIAMFSMEADPPYSRPKLSKDLWKDKPLEKIWRKTENRQVDIHLSDRISKVDPEAKTVTDQHGEAYKYDKLLFATGASPIRLPFGGEDIIYFRDFQDYLHLRELTEKGETFLVIGGGFIGSEIAAALTMNNKKVIMVFLENAIGERIYPKDLALFLNDTYREKGVEVLAGDSIESIEPEKGAYLIKTKSGQSFKVDGVVAGIGVRPNVKLAEETGLKVDNGIVVDEQLQTSHKDIYAAGDVANFFHAQLKKHVRVEHENNALKSGKTAGHNMAGANEAYTHVPLFYTDLFDLGYEAVGQLDSRMETITDWKVPYKKGVIYYLEDGIAKGILLWNVWDAVPAARSILAEAEKFDKQDLSLDLVMSRIEKKE